MPSLVSKLCLLLFGTALSVAQFTAIEGAADSLSTFPYDELDSSQVLGSDSMIGDNQFLPPPSSESPGTLTTQSSSECKPPPNQHSIKMRPKRDRCPNPFVVPNIVSPGQGALPTSQTDRGSNANGQINRNPKKQLWWQEFINLGNEIQDPKPCKHYRPFAVCAPPFTDMYTIFEIPLIEFCRLCAFMSLAELSKKQMLCNGD
ncbi:hypothetical protein MMC31_001705 [Peltigera leucophlebia]|nr:hypothetical protein [Peltigera leucophlebia]